MRPFVIGVFAGVLAVGMLLLLLLWRMHARYRATLDRDGMTAIEHESKPPTRWGWVFTWSTVLMLVVFVASFRAWWIGAAPLLAALTFWVLEASSRRHAWLAVPVLVLNLAGAGLIYARFHYPTDAERAEVRRVRARNHAITRATQLACEADAQGWGCNAFYAWGPFHLPSRYRRGPVDPGAIGEPIGEPSGGPSGGRD